ncbi:MULTISPECIES: hypothetical protein [Streptomyces]|uniref:hypothetical protein n=1 Tax=Streptomyces TaxID=1883 RepID=UPI0009790230|nr:MULTISPECIES: hypothetical protein [unclassified Streptomyces]ONI49245.1 hypothetical protein STIB_68050 [Streptomyces sp. IB2014 011-1]RDV47713.1 hypothetical protein DDV98_33535 [Streptomyces sp. IB2014 011-12]
MGRPSPLGDEDRSAYAEVVDEVLASAEFQRLLEESGVSGGRLRIRALAAVGRTAPAAAAEYRAYAALRRASHGRRGDGGPAPLSGPGHQERPGAGALAVLGVLTPILAAVAGATFLLLGYGLRLTDSMAALADTLVRVGWISLAIAAATSLISLVAVYRTAARRPAPGSPPGVDRSADLDRARETWRTALRDKAIRPFLLGELAEAGRAAAAPGGPRFTPPAFAGPDHTRPDHTRPDFSRPDFTGPGFSGPGHGSPGAGSPQLPDTRR